MHDADGVAHNPAMRAVVQLDRPAASTRQMGRFEAVRLTSETNLAALTELSSALIDQLHARGRRR